MWGAMKNKNWRKAVSFVTAALLLAVNLHAADVTEGESGAGFTAVETPAAGFAAVQENAAGQAAAQQETVPAAETEAKSETEVKTAPETQAEVKQTEKAADGEVSGQALSEKSTEKAAAQETNPEEPASEQLSSEKASEEPSTEQVSSEAAAAEELSAEQAAEKQTDSEEPLSEEELTEAVTEAADEKADPAEPDPDPETDPGSLSGIAIANDARGDYFSYEFDNPAGLSTTLTFTLMDSAGNQVGNTLTQTTGGEITSRIYLLPLAGNVFGLSEGDIGKSVYISISASNEAGSDEVNSSETVTLTLPSLSTPSIIACAAVDTAGQLYEPSMISGLSYSNGSFEVERSVQKLENGSWTAVSDGEAITAEDQGTYRICMDIVEPFGELYSNEFELVVPLTKLSVSGDKCIESTLTAEAVGTDGVKPTGLTYAWTYGDSKEAVGTDETYKAALKDAVNAQSVKLTLTAKDAIGNVFSQVVSLKPLDISKADIKADTGEDPEYTGYSQVPEKVTLTLGDFEIPSSLYSVAATDGKNSTNAGKAWMTVTGIEPYLTGAKNIRFKIAKGDLELEEDDFITEFTYDGGRHMPVLDDDADVDGKVTYKKWQKQNGGSWKRISGAPSDPGTYRVNITVKDSDKNYDKSVLKQVVFHISGSKAPAAPVQQKAPAKAAQPSAKDLTVTDQAGEPKGYTAAVSILKDKDMNETGRVYKIKAEPEKNADGTFVTDENGNVVWKLRNLHITGELLKKVKEANSTAIRFELGKASAQISLDALTQAGTYTLTLSPVDAAALTQEEQAEMTGYEVRGSIFAVKLTGPDGTIKTAPQQGLSVFCQISGETAEDEKLLFIAEDRDDPESIPEVSAETGNIIKENNVIYITGDAANSGIFCAV